MISFGKLYYFHYYFVSNYKIFEGSPTMQIIICCSLAQIQPVLKRMYKNKTTEIIDTGYK